MKHSTRYLLGIVTLAAVPLHALAGSVTLGTAGDYAVLAGSTITNTGSSVIDGDVGLSSGTAITGSADWTLTGTVHNADAAAAQAQSDLTAAYVAAAGLSATQDLTGSDLGGLTLLAGVYSYSTSAQLTGKLTLDGQGNADAVWVFQIGSTLTTASSAAVAMINSALGCHVYWQVGTSATLGTGTAFAGNILALSSITLNTDATIINGSALARNGAVTLDSNTITSGCPTTSGGGDTGGGTTVVPLPTTAAMGLGLLSLAFLAHRRRNRSAAGV